MANETPNIGLNVPEFMDLQWEMPLTENWNIIDLAIAGKVDAEVLSDGSLGILVAKDIRTDGQMYYSLASDPSYEDMYLRIGPGGTTSLHKVKDQDVHWVDTDATDIGLTATEVQVLSVTVDEVIAVGEGSYTISGKLTNTANATRTISIQVYKDGTAIGQPGSVRLLRNEAEKVFAFSGSIVDAVTSGAVLTVNFRDPDSDVILVGTKLVTKFDVTKSVEFAVATTVAESVALLEDEIHLGFNVPGNAGTTLSRAEIDIAVTRPLKTMESFYIYDDNGHVFAVVWTGSEYFYERLSKAR